MLPSAPPSTAESQLPLRRGASGWPVFALQGALGLAGVPGIKQDGDFGQATETVVRAFQRSKHLAIDGRVGPATRAALAAVVCSRIEKSLPDVPTGLARGMALGEGGDNFGAVNWSVPGGVDCGLWQYRVYGPPYNLDHLKLAFAPHRSGVRAMLDFLERRGDYLGTRWVGRDLERAARCAVMAHNWPVGARDIARTGRCSNPDLPCSWVPRDPDGQSLVRFADGSRVNTRWEWCQFYALGGTHGEASITRYVVNWR